MAFASKSPWVIHYDGSSCNGCDIEVLATLCPGFDGERFGVVNTGNPKHADIFLVTGSVNEQNIGVVREIYDQMLEPKVVVACGICACTGGIFKECYNILGGIDRADSGDILIDGERMADMNEKALTLYRRRHLGYIFQMYNLIPNLTVRENIEVGAYLSRRPLDVDELLHLLGLWDHRGKLPNQLSGGQQQRTSIGRAIVKNPDILLCDEPTGALDYKTSKEILKLIETVNQKYGNTVIMVTHNDAIRLMADRVVRLRDGAIRSNETNAVKVPAQDLEW